ncbi:MAG: hypothetical protein IPG45_12330 [Deltaproteobacteria bacterium]|nr:hypothetical protein [Deltaproteobacteria bacterium]
MQPLDGDAETPGQRKELVPEGLGRDVEPGPAMRFAWRSRGMWTQYFSIVTYSEGEAVAPAEDQLGGSSAVSMQPPQPQRYFWRRCF